MVHNVDARTGRPMLLYEFVRLLTSRPGASIKFLLSVRPQRGCNRNVNIDVRILFLQYAEKFADNSCDMLYIPRFNK